MTSALERDILALAGGSVSDLRRAIQLHHDQGVHIAAPYEPLLTAVQRVLNRGGNVHGAFEEVIRAHSYAFNLKDDKLAINWRFFLGEVNKY
jgi:hypothetical protein